MENLSQKTSKGKILKYVQPIDMFGSFFQFPTPLTASKAMSDEVDYRGAGGGHIDILARQGFGPHTKLTVIELKDECKDNEKPEKAIKQAIVYAVFLQRLLRSSQGKRWWKFFEFNKKKELGEVKLPDPLIIQAVIAMPTGKHNATDFVGEVEILSSEDKIELHYLYFNHKEGTLINGVTTSLPFQN